MKPSTFFLASSIIIAASVASAADYSIYRVCQDQRVIHTSDGAEAGHVEYIVVDPGNRQVVSTVVSGGVIGDHLVSIPYTSMRFDNDREITLTEITRERLVAAPVIERTQVSTSVIQPEIIQRTSTHFSARVDSAPQQNRTEANVEVRPPGNNERSDSEAKVRADEAAARQREQGNRPASTADGVRDANARTESEKARPAANPEERNRREERSNAGTPPAPEPKKHAGDEKPNRPVAEEKQPASEQSKVSRENTPPSKPQAKRASEEQPPAENERSKAAASAPGKTEVPAAEKKAAAKSPESEANEPAKSKARPASEENRKEKQDNRPPQP